jgi:hypothetical protein
VLNILASAEYSGSWRHSQRLGLALVSPRR